MTTEFKHQFIFRVGKICKQWGMGEPAGRVWGILLFNKEPLTQKEIAEQCNYSLGLVSPSIKILESMAMISNVGRRGKEKLYGIVITPLGSFGNLIRHFMEQDVKPIISLLDSNMEHIKDKEVKARLNIMITDYTKINLLLNLFSKMLNKKESLTITNIKKITRNFEKRWGL